MIFSLLGSSLSAIQVFAAILAFCVAICVAMSAHEYAHARVAYKCGDDTAKLSGRMTLNPLAHISGLGLLCFALVGFGWAKPVPINPTRFRNYKKDSTWVLLSGVITNFVLAFVFCGILLFASKGLLANGDNLLCFFVFYLLQYLFLINLSLGIFNLLPVPPLDGYNLLATWTKYNNRFTKFMGQYGVFFLIILIIPFFGGSSILSLFYNWFGNAYMWLWGLML